MLGKAGDVELVAGCFSHWQTQFLNRLNVVSLDPHHPDTQAPTDFLCAKGFISEQTSTSPALEQSSNIQESTNSSRRLQRTSKMHKGFGFGTKMGRSISRTSNVPQSLRISCSKSHNLEKNLRNQFRKK